MSVFPAGKELCHRQNVLNPLHFKGNRVYITKPHDQVKFPTFFVSSRQRPPIQITSKDLDYIIVPSWFLHCKQFINHDYKNETYKFQLNISQKEFLINDNV